MYSLLLTLLVALAAAAPQQAMPATVRVTGRVLDAATKEPLTAAQVTLLMAEPARAPAGLPLSRRAQTNSSGVYTLDVPPGRYLIQVQRPGFVPTGSTSATAPLTIGDRGASLPDIRLERGGTIEGRVLDDRGGPLPNMLVTALRPNNVRGGPGAVPVGVSAQTNDLGEFRLSGVPTGRFYVLVRPIPGSMVAASSSVPTFVPTYYPAFAELSSASLIDVTAGNTTNAIDVRILEAPTFVVSGVVVDRTGRPVAGAVAALSAVNGIIVSPYTATTRNDGTFSTSVPSGTYRLVATMPVIMYAGPSTSMSLRFAPSTTLGLDEMVEVAVDGYPVSGVRVVIQSR